MITRTPLPPQLQDLRQRRTDKPVEESKIAVVGLGYVGLPLALATAEKGCQVVGFDIDEKMIQQLKNQKSNVVPVEELSILKSGNITVGAETELLFDSDVFIICVPTPVKEDHTPDLSAVEGASQTVGAVLQRDALVIVESTVHPGTSEDIIIPILEKESGLKAGRDFQYAFCPERVNPGDDVYTTKNIPRVLGAINKRSLRRALAVYEKVLDAPVMPMQSLKEAEAVKMLENAFRDVNIAFVNELAQAFEREGIDIVNTINGAATKPFGFMAHYPGCGVGGHCIPVDPYYLIQYGKRHGFTHKLLIAARETNESMPLHTVKLVEDGLRERGGSFETDKVALLGLAYKKNISDMRESPALTILHELERKNAKVVTYDPFVPELSSVHSLDEALSKTSAVIIATDHDEFTALTPAMLEQHDIKVLVDGRNCLNKDSFKRSSVDYHGIGR